MGVTRPATSLLEPRSADALLLEQYRKLTRAHLESLPALFKSLTGLESHVAWAPAWPHRWTERDLPTHSRVCRQATMGSAHAPARCRNCAKRHLALTLASGHAGHQFICPCGVRNYWVPILVRRCTVGLAFVQGMDHALGQTPGRKSTSGVATSPDFTHPSSGRRRDWAAATRTSPAQFYQAAKLLQLIFSHVETAALADLRKTDLTKAQQALVVFENVQRRLREELNGLMPSLPKTGPGLQADTHAQQTVRALLERIRRDYAQPLTLKRCAAELGLNAAYLSDLFSHIVGLPFKACLTEVRVEKAGELLLDPAKNPAEVASAVGYASENRFRVAFKKATGLPPRLWRETMRKAPPAGSQI